MSHDLAARLRGYNPPDRTVPEQRQIAEDIAAAATELERLAGDLARFLEERNGLWGELADLRAALARVEKERDGLTKIYNRELDLCIEKLKKAKGRATEAERRLEEGQERE
jgi:septal ring factor EnvC (AmiA/AmiB activator)